MWKRIRYIPCLRPMSRACSGRPENPPPCTASPIRPTLLRSGGMTALWCVARRQISRRSGGASTRRDSTPLSSCSTPATGSLSPACSKTTASPLRLLACGSGWLFCRRYQSQLRRIQDGPPLAMPIKIPCVPGHRRREGWHRLPVQSADQHD